MDKVQLSVVIPAFNEQEVIEASYQRMKKVMDGLKRPYELIFVNDGSKDNTRAILNNICEGDKNVRVIHFSRNFGHQAAITAGMEFSRGDAVVVIDADLQDPPELIEQFVQKWEEGYDVVYGKRMERKGETFFKKFTAKIFYRFLDRMTNVEIPVDTGDFRLIDRKVCDAMSSIKEKNRYIRGLISWVGFNQCGVEYVREERYAGVTKYPLKKMIKFASDAITSFSYKPLKLATFSGFFISAISFLYLLWVIIEKVFLETAILPGWASILAVSLFFNGFILIILGVMGEYIGRIYDEIKDRPLYIVGEKRGYDKEM